MHSEDFYDLIVLGPNRAMVKGTGQLVTSFAGGGDEPDPPQVPEATEEERRLMAKQAEAADLQMEMARRSMARDERNQQRENALLPALYEQYGLEMIENPDGTFTAKKRAPTEIETQNEEIQKLANARQLAAMKGELPVDPAIEADMARQRAAYEEDLARRGIRKGSGDSYTRGIAELERNQNATRYAVRRGEMTTADAIARGREADLLNKQTTYLNQTRGIGTRGTADMLATSSGLFASAAEPHRARRFKNADYAYQTSLMEAQGANNLVSGGIQTAGTIGGALLLACWIAEVLYGPGTLRTELLRFWLNTLGERSRWVRGGMWLYRRYGRRVATYLEQHPWAQAPVRWGFNRLLVRAVHDLA